MKKLTVFLLSSLIIAGLAGPASAKITTTDHVFTPELLYLMIGVLFLFFTLIVWDAKTSRANPKQSVNLEYLLRAFMGLGSIILSFVLSSQLSSDSVVQVTSVATWSVASEWLSVFFLVWGFFMVIYTVGMFIKFLDERTAEAEKEIEKNGRNRR